MKIIKLYDYQQKMVSGVYECLKKGIKRILVYAAMRSGKTVVFCYLAMKAAQKKKKILIVTERIKLFQQTIGELSNFGIVPEEINANTKYVNPDSYVFLAMPLTLKNKIKKPFYLNLLGLFGSVLIDECHRTVADYLFDLPELKNACFLGFTGSPKRSGNQRQLAQNYNTIVYGPSTIELENIGRVNRLKVFSIKNSVDRDKIKVNHSNSEGDEFSNAANYSAMNRPELYAGAIEAYKKHTPDTMAICYNVKIIHAVKTCIEFNKAGIPSKFITSAIAKPKYPKYPTPDRITKYKLAVEDYNLYKEAFDKYSGDEETLLKQWVKGEFKVLQNVDKYTFGFNEPKLVTVIVNRAVMSLPLWVQMANRSTTFCEGKDYSYLIDMAGNYKALGMPNDPHDWSLIHKTPDGSNAPAYKECGKVYRKGVQPDPVTGYYPDKLGHPGCGYYLPAGVMVCPVCGYNFQTEKELIRAEIEEIDYTVLAVENRVIPEPDRIAEIIAEGSGRGYKAGWALRKICYELGIDGLKKYAKEYINQNSFGWLKRMEIQYSKELAYYEENKAIEQ